MTLLALIPARGGSKGIPRKNLAMLGGQPLIAWTIAAAQGAGSVARVVVSTDDLEIAEVARTLGAEVPFMRPAALADDTASALDVARHALDELAATRGWQAETLAYLQPTSPFRTAADIDRAATLLDGADTVVSVVEVPHNMRPASQMTRNERGFLDFAVPPEQQAFRRQDKAGNLFARNGPALLLTRSTTIRAGRIYGDRIAPLAMGRLRSLDIDEPADLLVARALFPFLIGGDPEPS